MISDNKITEVKNAMDDLSDKLDEIFGNDECFVLLIVHDAEGCVLSNIRQEDMIAVMKSTIARFEAEGTA